MARSGPIPTKAKVVTASALRIDGGDGNLNAPKLRAKPKEWQAECWGYFHGIGEVKQATYILANTMSLVRLHVALKPTDDEAPAVPDDNEPGYFEARMALDRLKGENGTHGWLMQAATMNLCPAGEFYLVGFEATDAAPPTTANSDGSEAQPERWTIHSVREFTGVKDEYKLRTSGDSAQGDRMDPQPDFVLRCWTADPEFSADPDSWLRAMRLECDELMILGRVIRGAGRNRIAGNGALLVPSELSFGADEEGEEDDGEDGDKFASRLMTAMIEPIGDEGHASSVVPIVIRGPAETLKEFRHVTFDRPWDKTATEQRKELLERLMQSADVPIEMVTGLAKVNHWTAWQVDASTWNRYGQPKAQTICDQLTTGFLRGAIEASGIAPDIADRFMVHYDPANAIVQADRSQVTVDAYDRVLISDEAARRILGFGEDDAPDDAEVARRIALIQALGGGSAIGTETGGPASGPPNQGQPPQGGTSRIRRIAASVLGRRPVSYAAPAPRKPLGERLAAIDRDLMLRLHEAAEAAMLRALSKAGARVRNRAAKNSTTRAAVDRLPAAEVTRRLGATVVASLGFTEDDLIRGGLEGLDDRFRQLTAAAQRRVLDELAAELDLSPAEVDALAQQQQHDRHEAWLWLEGALTALAGHQLYRAAEPGRGEAALASDRVPPGLIRESLARAGGAAGGSAPGQPQGGVGLGKLVMDLWAKNGRVVAGWTWVHDDPLRSFDAHDRLDGVSFQSWTDPVLAVDPEDSWLGVEFYVPGDHDGCLCDFVADMGDGSDTGDGDQADSEDALAGA